MGKRYYKIVAVAKVLSRSYPAVRNLCEALNIVIHRETLCIDHRNLEYLKGCVKLMDASNMTYAFLRKLRKEDIKTLIKRI